MNNFIEKLLLLVMIGFMIWAINVNSQHIGKIEEKLNISR